MPFISYAQNYEDVMLWRALRDAKQGFYVDVGAADPEEWSVTKAFYERGWSGINLEPLDEYFSKLTQERSRDTNLQIAAGRETGLRSLYTFAGTGLSTLDPQVAQRQKAADWKCAERVISVLPLTQILADYASRDIHFLKIDVEGAEGEVLEGLDLGRVRPWIVVVEATEPLSTVGTRAQWEHLVTERGYDFVYFDGLNAFYLAKEKSVLKERFGAPPNVFDDFVRWREWRVANDAAHLERLLEVTRSETANLGVALDAEKKHSVDLRNSLAAEQRHANGLREALAVEQRHTNDLRDALAVEQRHTSDLRNALVVEQAQTTHLQHTWLARLDYLSARVENVHAQLAFPWPERAMGHLVEGLQQTGNRVTGGGVRAATTRLTKACLDKYVAFTREHPRLAAIPRTILKPFPKFSARLESIAVQPASTSTTKISVPAITNNPDTQKQSSEDWQTQTENLSGVTDNQPGATQASTTGALSPSAQILLFKLKAALGSQGDT
jgi:FkbM family methyltransferase